jgi:hypothetical protein
MYLNEENYLPLEVLVPTMLMHNLYRRMDMNSILSGEIDWTPIPHLNLYGQFVLDELNIAFTENVGDNATPEANGFMLGAKTAFPLLSGMFNASLEGAFTSPYLYLRSRKGQADQQQAGEYGAGFIAATRYMTTEYTARYVEQFLGYQYGGDAIVINVNAAYTEINRFNVGANLFFMIHGTHDIYTTWSRVNNTWVPTYQNTPTTSHQTPNHLDQNPKTASSLNTGASGERDAPAYTLAFSLSGSWNIMRDVPWVKSLDLYGQFDIVTIINPGNISTHSTASDFQFTLGIRYSF